MTKSNITEQFKEIIDKDLPNQVGTELQKVLKQAETDSQEVKNLKKLIDDLNRTITDYETLGLKSGKLDSRSKELDQRELQLKEKEQTQKEAELQLRVDSAEAKVTFVKEVCMGLVRNTNYRKSTSGMEVGHDNQGYPVSVPTNKDETTTAD